MLLIVLAAVGSICEMGVFAQLERWLDNMSMIFRVLLSCLLCGKCDDVNVVDGADFDGCSLASSPTIDWPYDWPADVAVAEVQLGINVGIFSTIDDLFAHNSQSAWYN